MRYALKRDGNDATIFATLALAGRNPVRFFDFDIGAEHVDGHGLMLELKVAKGKLRAKQVALQLLFKDRYIVCRSVEDALKACGIQVKDSPSLT